jgi:hypothetical protein
LSVLLFANQKPVPFFDSNCQDLDRLLLFVDIVKDPEAITGSEPQFPSCTEWAGLFKRLTIPGDVFRRVAELLGDSRFDEAMVFALNCVKVVKGLGRVDNLKPTLGYHWSGL